MLIKTGFFYKLAVRGGKGVRVKRGEGEEGRKGEEVGREGKGGELR